MNSSFHRFTTNIAIRLNKHWFGSSIQRASHDVTVSSADQTGADQHINIQDVNATGNAYEVHPDLVPIADNDDLYRVRFKKRGMTKFKRMMVKGRRLLRRVTHFVIALSSRKLHIDEKWHMLTTLHEWRPDDLEDHRRAKEEDKLFMLHKQQARILEKQIIDILTNLRFNFSVTKDEKVYVKKKIKFDHTYVSPFAYTYVATNVPYGVKKTEIAADWVATELSSSIGKKVRIELDLSGLHITVEVGSTLSIPNFASFSDIEKMPKNMGPLTFYAGKTTNGADVFRNLAEAPHMIIAGQTGGGKSNMLNSIICGYLLQPPTVVQMVLFDLKSGIEFSMYYGVPHLWRFDGDTDGVIEYPEGVLPALRAIHKECDRRIKLIKDVHAKKIEEYNRKKTKNRLPYLIVPFDEYAIARGLGGKDVETELVNIANKSRVAGIHFIIGTQYPKSEIFSPLIKVNFPWRFAFNMTSGASMSVINSWDASGLSPVGRAIMQSSTGDLYLQTPRITETTITSIVDAAKSGSHKYTISTVDPEEIMEWALNNTGGKLDRDTVFNHFKEKITVAAINTMLHSMEKQTYEVQGTLYTITPPAGNLPRRIEKVDGSRIAELANDKQQTTVTSEEKAEE